MNEPGLIITRPRANRKPKSEFLRIDPASKPDRPLRNLLGSNVRARLQNLRLAPLDNRLNPRLRQRRIDKALHDLRIARPERRYPRRDQLRQIARFPQERIKPVDVKPDFPR